MGDDSQRAVDVAAAYFDAAKPDAALRMLGPHLAAHPDDVRANLIAAQSLLALHDPKAARDRARRVTGLDPDNAVAWRMLARSLSALGRHDDARAAALTAQRLAPNWWLAHIAVAEVDVTSANLTDDGIAAARTALELAPGEPDAHLVMGNVARIAKDLDGASASYRAALRIAPGHPNASNNLALVILEQGQAGAAATGFLDVLATRPDHAGARANLTLAIRVLVTRVFQLLGATVTVVLIVSLIVLAIEPQPAWLGVATRVLFVAAALGCTVQNARYLITLQRAAGGRFGQLVRVSRHVAWQWAGFVPLLAAVFALIVVACVTPFVVSIVLYAIAWVLLVVVAVVSGAVEARQKRLAAELRDGE